MRYFLYILLFLITSCGVLKKKETVDNTVSTTEIERVVSSRPPSKVVSETKYNVKYKDTTIVTTNYETKTILNEIYDSDGNRQAECICDGIRDEIERVREVVENDIRTTKDTSHNFDITPLIWALSGFLGVVIVLALVVLYAFNKSQKATQELLQNLLLKNT